MPNADCGSPTVMVLLAWDAETNAAPSESPAGSCQAGDANPCTSTSWDQASAAAIV